MAITLTDLLQPKDEVFATLQDAMTALVGRYTQAVFSDIDFEHDTTIWVWVLNAASQSADPATAVAWLRQTPDADRKSDAHAD